MANSTPPSVPGDEPGKTRAADAAPVEDKATNVTIALKRLARCGDVELAEGTPIAVVRLRPGVSLAYLVDAVRNGLAAEAVD